MGLTEEEKVLVAGVRSDAKIGRGTCSMIDECWEDEEIAGVIREDRITTLNALLDALYKIEGIWRERANDVLAAGGEKPIWEKID